MLVTIGGKLQMSVKRDSILMLIILIKSLSFQSSNVQYHLSPMVVC